MVTTFQAIVQALVYGFSIFFPVSANAHLWALDFFTGWGSPPSVLFSAFYLASAVSLTGYFFHDILSIVSSLFRVLFFAKKPMTLDERMPFFLFMTVLPYIGLEIYLFHNPLDVELSPIWYASCLGFFSLPLILADRLNRKTKSMLDWNWADSVVIGISQLLIFLPGAGRQVGALTGALLRNYRFDAAIKFILLSYIPILFYKGLSGLHGFSFSASAPAAEMSWLTFSIGVAVAFFASLLSIGGLFRGLEQRKSVQTYAYYRIVLALVILGYYGYRLKQG